MPYYNRALMVKEFKTDLESILFLLFPRLLDNCIRKQSSKPSLRFKLCRLRSN